MLTSATISDYSFSRISDACIRAEYNLHLPPEHFANGTKNEIIQRCSCTISFINGIPTVHFANGLVRISKPERFGPYRNAIEEEQYLYTFIHDTATNS